MRTGRLEGWLSNHLKWLLIITLLISLSGCASTNNVKPSSSGAANTATVEPAAAGPLQPAEEPKKQAADEELLMPPIKKEMISKPLPPKVEHVPVDVKRVSHVEGDVILNAESMPLSDFVVYAMGETLKVTFFMDEAVMGMKNPITLRMTKEMPAEKALEVVI